MRLIPRLTAPIKIVSPLLSALFENGVHFSPARADPTRRHAVQVVLYLFYIRFPMKKGNFRRDYFRDHSIPRYVLFVFFQIFKVRHPSWISWNDWNLETLKVTRKKYSSPQLVSFRWEKEDAKEERFGKETTN